MQKISESCIKISEFANICRTNRRTLLHYDEIGLFRPAFTDENGYRYYTEGQCDVFFTITCLKDLGMPLKEIKTFVEHRTPEQLDQLLSLQLDKVERELARFARIKQVIQVKKQLIHDGYDIRFSGRISDVKILQEPTGYYLCTRRLDSSDHGVLFSNLTHHIGEGYAFGLNYGHLFGAALSTQDVEKGVYNRYAYYITKIKAPHPEFCFLEKPEGRYLTIYLLGDYSDAGEALAALMAYAHGKGIPLGQFVYKEAVWDELTVMHREQYITKISVQIREEQDGGSYPCGETGQMQQTDKGKKMGVS